MQVVALISNKNIKLKNKKFLEALQAFIDGDE